jgi:uncharacterized protein (DUF1800 family)
MVGFASRNDGGSQKIAGEPPGAGPTPIPAADLDQPIQGAVRSAGHLLRRAGFGGTRAEIEAFAALSPEAAADRLLNYESTDNSALDARVAAANFNLTYPGRVEGKGPLLLDMQRWWLTRMAYTARPLEERMTLIWHGLLTSQVSKIGPQRARLMVQQNELFRSHALGRYDDLLHAIGKDPAMLIYLDTVESTKANPNENYARELMELYSMAVGNYTEDDVRESARAFTGWRLTAPQRQQLPEGLSEEERRALQNKIAAEYQPEFFVAERQHDAGTKTFLDRTGSWDGDDIVDIIMEQPATARYMSRRLFTEFAHYNPSDETIERLAAIWETSGHSVKAVVRAILVSDEFYSERSYRAIVRSPVELTVNMVRALELETNFQGLEHASRGWTRSCSSSERGRLAWRGYVALVGHVLRQGELPRSVPDAAWPSDLHSRVGLCHIRRGDGRSGRRGAHRRQHRGRRAPVALRLRAHRRQSAGARQLSAISCLPAPTTNSSERRVSHGLPKDFVKGGVALVSIGTTASSLLKGTVAFAAGNPGDVLAANNGKTLVLVQLAGGNDGLATLAPIGDATYRSVRNTLAIPDEQLLLRARHGIEPEPHRPETALGRRASRDRAWRRVPQQNYSHFKSMAIWEAGDPELKLYDGWLGRALEKLETESHDPSSGSTWGHPHHPRCERRQYPCLPSATRRSTTSRSPASLPAAVTLGRRR